MVRRLAVFFAAVMVLSMLGCERASLGTSEESAAESMTEGTTASESTSESTKVDLGGYEFTILGTQYSDFLWLEEPRTQEQQTYMDIWRGLEAEYGFTVKVERDIEFSSELEACIMSGTKAADIIYTGITVDASMIGQYLKRLDTDEVRSAGLDITNGSIFEQNYLNAARVDGGAYFFYFCGMYYKAQTGSFAAFNKRLCADAGYPAEVIYEAVREKKWTWDVYLDICRAGMMYNVDTGAYSVFGTSGIGWPFLMTAYGCDMIAYDGGKYVPALESPPANAAIGKLLEMRADGIIATGQSPSQSNRVFFYDRQAVFGIFYEMYNLPSSCSFDFGIVPLPTGDTNMTYRSPLWGGPAFAIQKANEDWETSCFITGKIAEALGDTDAGINSLYSYARDEASKEMLREYILPGLYSDPLFLSEQCYSIMSDYIRAKTDGDRELAAQYTEAFDAAVDRAFEMFNK